MKKPVESIMCFPENRKIAINLKRGDRKIIAENTGFSVGYIYDVFKGYRRLTDDIAKAVISLLEEREKINEKLNSIVSRSH